MEHNTGGGDQVQVEVTFEDGFLGVTIIDDKSGRTIADVITSDRAQIETFFNDVTEARSQTGL